MSPLVTESLHEMNFAKHDGEAKHFKHMSFNPMESVATANFNPDENNNNPHVTFDALKVDGQTRNPQSKDG